MNNWGWQVQNIFINKTLQYLLIKKYKNFNSILEQILLNNKIILDLNYKLKKFDQVFILNKTIKLEYFLKPNISKIIHETKNFLIVFKGYGIVTHPDKHHKNNTLLNFVKNKLNFLNKEEILKKNLGIVHRLDKPTTGLLIVAKNLEYFSLFKKMMLTKEIKKFYLAIVEGIPKNIFFTINAPLLKPGKNKRSLISFLGVESITHVEVLNKNNKHSLLKIGLETGRTHQIRAHLRFINTPIKNDKLYNSGESNFIFLHAYKIEFKLLENNLKFKFSKPFYFKII